jgi:hypothetical protein
VPMVVKPVHKSTDRELARIAATCPSCGRYHPLNRWNRTDRNRRDAPLYVRRTRWRAELMWDAVPTATPKGDRMNAPHGLIRGIVAIALALGLGGAAAAHPMDPLSADEIGAAANILLNARAAQPGAL